MKEYNSSAVTFQRLFSSGLLTVRPNLNSTLWNNDQQCLYFVYMRGRFQNSEPLLPDEIHFNRSSCLTCQRKWFAERFDDLFFWIVGTQLSSITPTPQDITTHLMTTNDSTSQYVSISTSLQPLSSNYRTGLYKNK